MYMKYIIFYRRKENSVIRKCTCDVTSVIVQFQSFNVDIFSHTFNTLWIFYFNYLKFLLISIIESDIYMIKGLLQNTPGMFLINKWNLTRQVHPVSHLRQLVYTDQGYYIPAILYGPWRASIECIDFSTWLCQSCFILYLINSNEAQLGRFYFVPLNPTAWNTLLLGRSSILKTEYLETTTWI